jgi:hypothetical protein
LERAWTRLAHVDVRRVDIERFVGLGAEAHALELSRIVVETQARNRAQEASSILWTLNDCSALRFDEELGSLALHCCVSRAHIFNQDGKLLFGRKRCSSWAEAGLDVENAAAVGEAADRGEELWATAPGGGITAREVLFETDETAGKLHAGVSGEVADALSFAIRIGCQSIGRELLGIGGGDQIGIRDVERTDDPERCC